VAEDQSKQIEELTARIAELESAVREKVRHGMEEDEK
jgi:hypothetical protein